MKRRTAIAAIAAATGTLSLPGHAQSFPDRPIRLVIGYPPGGASDNMSRQLAKALAEKFKQPVIVDNRPGANTIIASQYVAGSRPDGYTLFHVDTSTLALNQFLYPSLPFNPLTSFTPLAQTTNNRIGLLVPVTSPFTSVRDMVAAAKTRQVTVASAGPGNITHITLELFKRYAGIELTHIPYKGSAPAMQDLMGGQVDAYFTDIPSSISFIKSGRLKLLGVMSNKRLEELPNVPTFAEAGYPDFSVVAWFGVVGPAQMPAPLVAQLSEAILEAVSSPELSGWMKSQTFEPNLGNPADFARVIRSDAEKYGKVIKEIGLKLD